MSKNDELQPSPSDPTPVWFPDEKTRSESNLTQLMREVGVEDYPALHHWSVEQVDDFWAWVVQRLGIRFKMPYKAVRATPADVKHPGWLAGAALNIVDSCFQAPVDAIAVRSDFDGVIKDITYGELAQWVDRIAGALIAFGIKPGDRIAVYLPMHPAAVAIYLAIIKVGAVVVSIADSFAPEEIKTRLSMTDPALMITQDSFLRNGKQHALYEKAKLAEAPRAVVLCEQGEGRVTLREGDLSWDAFCTAAPVTTSVSRNPDDPINILFSSGTTGTPKAIPWTQITPIKVASDAFFHQDIHPGDVLAWPTNLGWMMGPWLIFAALLNRATIALSQAVPTTKAFGEFVEKAQVTMLGIVPSLVNTWRASQCMETLNWSAIRCFSSTGECSNPDDMQYLMQLAGNKPIIEYCGGTEIGGGYLTSTLFQPNAPSCFTTPAMGLSITLLDDNGQTATQGEVAIKPPSIGLSETLLNADHDQVYYAGMPKGEQGEVLRRHGDHLERVSPEFYRALGRVDDTMNLGGIKISATEIERVLNTLPEIIETAAIALPPEKGGPNQLIIYAVLKEKLDKETLRQICQAALNAKLNPLLKIQSCIILESLPRTPSNKVMRRLLRRDAVTS